MKAAQAMIKLSAVSQLNTSDVDSDEEEEAMDTAAADNAAAEKPDKTPPAPAPAALPDDDELNLLSDEEDRETGEKVRHFGLGFFICTSLFCPS